MSGQRSTASKSQFITFKFTGTKPTIRDSRVTDPWGRNVLMISSIKKESTLHNVQGQVLALIGWKHSLPRVRYRGSEVKSKDLLPLERKSMIRGMTHESQTYGWRGSPDEMSVGLYHPSAPEKCLAYWHNEEQVIFLEASPEVCETAGLLDVSHRRLHDELRFAIGGPRQLWGPELGVNKRDIGVDQCSLSVH